MKFECDSCHAQYMIADEKLGTRGVKVKCKRCSHVIIVRPEKPADEADEPPTAASTPAPDTFLDHDARAAEGAGEAVGDFDDEPTRATFQADTEVLPAPPALAEQDTVAGDLPPPQAAESTLLAEGLGLDDDYDDDDVDVDEEEGADDNPFLQPAPSASASEGFPSLNDDEEDEDETHADLSARPSIAEGADESEESGEPAGADGADERLRMDSELDGDPFFGDAAEEESEEAEPPAPALAADVPAPPPPDALPGPPEGVEGGAMPSMPALGDADDLLEGELAGAFGAMFADAGDDENERGPTQVLDLDRVDQLRAESLRSEVQGGGLDELRTGLDANLPFGGGLSPFVTGAHDGQTGEAPPEASEELDDGEWHAAIDDEDVGPLTLKEIGEHIQAGAVDRETLVWRPGMDDWTPAGEVREVRPLFDAVPRPRIGSGEGGGSFDVGAPLDDLGPSPFTSGEVRPDANDPFGAIPGFDTDDNDGTWQPHGLTEVYQAANLAEAAGGLGAQATPPPPPGAAGALDDDDDVDWKPGAGSALASLVSSEIERLDSPGFGEGTLPPAADDALSLDLDNAPLGAMSSAGIGGLGSLDVPGGQDEHALPPPAFGSAPQAMSPALSGAMAPTPSVAGMPMAPYPGMPGSPLKNPLVLAAAVGGSLVIVLLFAVVLLLVLREPAPVIAQQPVPAAVPPAGVEQPSPAAPAPDPAALAAAAAAATPTPPPPEEPAAPAAEDASPESEEGPAAATASADTPESAEEPPPPAATPPKPKTAEKAERKAPARVAAAQKRQSERKVQRRQQRKQSRQRAQQARRARNCDPVLDLDCDERPARSSTRRAQQKAELTPSDVLAVIKRNLPSVNRCAAQHKAKGTLRMEWRILKSGATSSVRVTSPNFTGTPVGDCVTGAIRRWKFPASNKPPREAIKFPFKLSG